MARPKSPNKNNGGLQETPPTQATAEVGMMQEAASVVVANAEPPKTGAKKASRKPQIVKTEPRANLLPISLDDEIRSLAYLLSERRGFEPGHETEDWLSAEREVLARYHQQRA